MSYEGTGTSETSQALIGDDKDCWGSVKDPEKHTKDLIVLRPRQNLDPFSEWFTGSFIRSFHKRIGHRWMTADSIYGIQGYRDSGLLRVTRLLTTVVASVLPVVAIVVLYNVTSMAARLAIVAAFTITLSICLFGFTGARGGDIFAATAAYGLIPYLRSWSGFLTST